MADDPDDGPIGTIQMRVGEPVPVLPTLRGDAAAAPGVVAPPALPPTERYALRDEIARGGMGRVVEAMDTVLGRTVALKEALSLDPDVLRRFARETRITARLEHPSIVPVHDAGTLAFGAPFYVMRKVSGRPLEQLVAKADTLPQRLALVPHIVATAHAIAHAHERGIVHRDIKPSNILVGDNGETIVIDWGLAKVIGEVDEPVKELAPTAGPGDIIKTRAGIVYGTPGFMAPEQLRGAPVDEKVDVYALGATLYHLLSRKPPHYAKTAEEMMLAAVNAGATPIGELVSGVPPELSTIVDKALAHDPAQRYADAGAVADDLQRFLTGQLVASHRYTPREKLIRFVRKNRTPVTIASAATLAILVLGTFAVWRVVDERDRADEAARIAVAQRQVAETERQRAEDRADQLTITQARNEVETNPTRAVAMLKPLAAKRPDDVRSIALAARASGVAWSMPLSKRTSTLELAREGRRVLTAGDDGVVRIHELDTRSTRTIATFAGAVSARFADTERKVIAWQGTRLTVIQVASGARVERVVETPIIDLELVGQTAYWVDDRGGLWQHDLAGTPPVAIPLDERIAQLAPSPDGRWLALYGEFHLLLYDRTAATEPVRIVADGKPVDADWADDGSVLAALLERDPTSYFVLQVEMHPEPLIVHRLTVGNRRFVAYSADRMYTIGPTGVAIVARDQESGVRKQLVGGAVGLRETRGGAIVAASQAAIAVLSDAGDQLLEAPGGHLDIVEASPRSPYILGVVEDRLLVWTLDAIGPRALATQAPTFAAFLGPDHVIATFADGPALLVEAATGQAQPIGEMPTLRQLASSPSGALGCALDETGAPWLLGVGRVATTLDGTADVVAMPSDRDVVLATRAGLVQHHDARQATRTTLLQHGSPLAELVATRGEVPWVATRHEDRTLWRANLRAGTSAKLVVPVAPTSPITIAPDGTVLFAEARKLRAWRTDGTLVEQAELPRPITRLAAIGAGRALAFTADGTSHVVELALHRATESVAVGPTVAAVARETGLAVVQDAGGIAVIEPITRHRWRLASAPGGGLEGASRRAKSYEMLQITADGRRVLARTRDGLFTWALPMPGRDADLASWLDKLTNAVVEPQAPGGIAWR